MKKQTSNVEEVKTIIDTVMKEVFAGPDGEIDYETAIIRNLARIASGQRGQARDSVSAAQALIEMRGAGSDTNRSDFFRSISDAAKKKSRFAIEEDADEKDKRHNDIQ